MTDPQALARVLPGYEIGQELGRGGFGIVLSGTHRQLGRPVAIKQLPAGLSSDPAVRARFVTEARLLAGLDHPHVVPVYDYVEQDGLCVLVMEALAGGSVWGQFTSRGYAPAAACALVMVACSGLHHAHQRGILHRDVKPENLLLTQTGQLKVADFGIAKVLGADDALATSRGEVLGTPAYMAPEQAQGRDLGPGADVYAAGVMLYELLSGRLPYSEEGGPLAIVYRHVHEDPVPLAQSAPSIPAPLAAVVMRALARDPRERYPDAEAFGVALGEAATEAFGAGWLQATNVPVLAGGAIVASTQRLTAPPTAYREAAVTRAVLSSHVGGAGSDVAAEDLVPVRQVLVNPPRPLLAGAVTAGLAVLLAGLALSPPHAARPAPRTLTVNGLDASTTPVVDLGKPVVLGPGQGEASLSLSTAGVSLGTAGHGRLGQGIKLGSTRFLAARTVDATATVRGRLVRFPLRAKANAFTTAPGIAAVVALLFLLAYAESQLAPLRRRGRRRIASFVGLGLAGAGVGGLAAVFSWLLGSEPLAGSAVLRCAAVGAGLGVALGVATYQAGRRARLRRIARKQGLTGQAA